MISNIQSSLVLSGKKQTSNLLKLSGKNIQPVIPKFVSDIQITIMNNLILPILSSQWAVVKQNIFLVEVLMPRLVLYYSTYKLQELLVYQNILTMIKNILNEHMQLVDLEEKHYGSTLNNLTNIVYKTAMISLKPEYGLYNMIVGQPDFMNGESFNPTILNAIYQLMSGQSVSYDIIKSNIVKQFNL